MEKRDFEDLIQKKISDAEKFLIVELNPNDPMLADQITLGDDWDNPFKLAKALDKHSAYYARWATLLKTLKQKRQRLTERKNVWESKIKKDIENQIFKENKVKGMTANNAKPSSVSVEYRFNSIYNAKNEDYVKYNKSIINIERQIDIVEVVVKAFEQRKDMLVSMGHLVRTMIEKDLLVCKKLIKK